VELRATVAGREQVWQGELVRLDASIDSATRMLYGMVEVIDPYSRNISPQGMPLAVGLFVSAEIVGPVVPNAFVISRNALRAGNSVYLITDAGHLDIREVDVMHSTAERAVIAAGLNEGEKVIVSAIRNPIVGMALEAQTYAGEAALATQGIIPNDSIPVASSGG
jgi:multidrug efflux pump subunit AcrA (membrane-fusion protein)